MEKEGFLLDQNGKHYRSIYMRLPSSVVTGKGKVRKLSEGGERRKHTVLTVLQILCFLVGGAMANYEEKTVIGETTGKSLEKEGFLLDRNGKHYRSLFLKAPNPITASEMPNLIWRAYSRCTTRAPSVRP
eukprot:sb/3475179/